MNILLLNYSRASAKKLGDLSCTYEEASILTDEQGSRTPSDTSGVEIIVAYPGCAGWAIPDDLLLSWRAHPHTYLTPCWIVSEPGSFLRHCLWPKLSIDKFDVEPDAKAFCHWMDAVAEWQQNRTLITECDALSVRGPIEIITSLGLRRATGRLTLFDDEGGEGSLYFDEGCLIDASIRHLKGVEAFFDFLSWEKGGFHWQPGAAVRMEMEPQPTHTLIEHGLRMLRQANLLFHFISDLNDRIEKTDSESALDDRATPFFSGFKEIYGIIDGTHSIASIIDASPLSRPRTMTCLAKWFSLGDIRLTPPDASALETDAVRRILIVDDSPVMRKAIKEIVVKDSHLGVAGVAQDGIEALELMKKLDPDVVTLDMQMPRMDGLTTLKHIMIRNPKPVVVLSAFTKEASQLTYESFKYGAVDVVTKPSHGDPRQMEKQAMDLRERILQACSVRLEAAQYIRRSKKSENEQRPESCADAADGANLKAGIPVVVICGEGGFPSLLRLLLSIPQGSVHSPVIACMALPEQVIEALLPNLDRDCKIPVSMLSRTRSPQPGEIYLCSYERYYEIEDADIIKEVTAGEDLKRRAPFDSLLMSHAERFGRKATAMLLSGAGNDGLEGMRKIREKGGSTFALSPEACLKPALARKSIEAGLAHEIKSISELSLILQETSLASHDHH